MSRPLILFLSVDGSIGPLLDDGFSASFEPLFLHDDEGILDVKQRANQIQALVFKGYSEHAVLRKVREAGPLLQSLSTNLPRIYLLHESAPTLEPDRVDHSHSVLHLRGPISATRLALSLTQLLGKKPRPRRFELDARLQIGTRFQLRDHHTTRKFYREVLEIGPTGMSFLWSREAPAVFPGDMLTGLTLYARGQPFWESEAEIRHLTPFRDNSGQRSLRVGIAFSPREKNGSTKEYQSILSPLDQSHLADPLLVQAILDEVREQRYVAHIKPEGLGGSALGHITELIRNNKDERVHLKLSKLPPPGLLHPMDIISVSFVRDNAQLSFSTLILDADGPDISVRFPKRLHRLWSRSNLRYLPPAEQNITVDIYSPIASEQAMNRKLIDISPDGLSFAADPTHDLLLPGMKLRQVCIHVEDRPPIWTPGEVRHLGQPTSQEGSVPCGIQFGDMDQATQHQLVDYLTSKNFPSVMDVRSKDVQGWWDFLLQTNYLSEAKRLTYLYPEEEVKETQSRLLVAPKHLSRTLLYRDERDISGSISLTRIYSKTWLVHHLAASLRISALVPKNLLLYLGEYISKTPDIQYVRMMWRPANNWSNRMLGRMIHRIHNHEQSVVKVYSYLQRSTNPLPPAPNLGWKLRPLERGEELELEAHFTRTHEFFQMKAEDLHREDPFLDGLNGQYRLAGLRRRRQILIAERNGEIGGFCLIENGSAGLNLSNLLHGFRVIITEEGQGSKNTIYALLIEEAVRLLREMGQKKAVALIEDPDIPYFQASGFTKIKEYISWTFGQDIASFYNLYCHYIFRVYERLERRLRRRQERMQASGKKAPSAKQLEETRDKARLATMISL